MVLGIYSIIEVLLLQRFDYCYRNSDGGIEYDYVLLLFPYDRDESVMCPTQVLGSFHNGVITEGLWPF